MTNIFAIRDRVAPEKVTFLSDFPLIFIPRLHEDKFQESFTGDDRMTKKKSQTTSKPSQNTSFPDSFTTPNYLDVSTKPIDVEKPINGFDYLNALVRIPEVQKDLELLSKEPTKEKKLELINKYWGIYRFSPQLLQNPRLFYKHQKYFHNSEAIHVFSNWEKDPLLGGHDPLSKYRDGRHVILAVDITKKKQTVINEFKKLLSKIEKDYDIPRDTTRDKDTKEDIWKIYDYKTKERLSFLSIARRKTGLNENPAICQELDTRLKSIKRAYHKAEEIINTVKGEVCKVVTENAEKQKKQKASDALNKMIIGLAEEQRKKGKTIAIADRLLGRIPVDE